MHLGLVAQRSCRTCSEILHVDLARGLERGLNHESEGLVLAKGDGAVTDDEDGNLAIMVMIVMWRRSWTAMEMVLLSPPATCTSKNASSHRGSPYGASSDVVIGQDALLNV